MSTTFIIISAIVVIIMGRSVFANGYSSTMSKMGGLLSPFVFFCFVISVFYNHGIKFGVIYLIIGISISSFVAPRRY